MDPIIFQYIRELWKQVKRKLHWVLLGAAIIGFMVLVSGKAYQPKYDTSITIYADNQNVIKPLLEGRASVTMPKTERIRIVQETIFSPRMLEQVIQASFDDTSLITGSDAMEDAMNELRSNIELSAPASNYIKVSYSHENPEVCYRVVNKITNLFIEESARNKRAESKSAYTFIDEQVKSYKNQLVDAESKLKSFEAANVDGVESQVNASIARLQRAIDDISIDAEAEEVRIAALEVQLSNEDRFASSDYNARVYRDRLAQLEAQMDTLKLNYRDGHPDVIDMRLQIQDLKKTIVEVENANQNADNNREDLTGERSMNPIYEELSTQLSSARVTLQTMQHRLRANQNRLESQYQRRVRVAGNTADLSELTRDYSVTKGIYEDLLERKERARISMTLDLAGQGVTYKVLEPAIFPIEPTGLRFLHFVIAGPMVGLVIPLGILVLLFLLDSKIRLAEQLEDLYPGIVLAVLPAENVAHQNWKFIAVTSLTVLVAYTSLALTFRYI